MDVLMGQNDDDDITTYDKSYDKDFFDIGYVIPMSILMFVLIKYGKWSTGFS